jgi:hypothetical protein
MNGWTQVVLYGLLAALAVVGLGSVHGHPHDIDGAVSTFQADLQYAEELARTTGDGATLTITVDSSGRSTYEVWAHRPIVGLTAMEASPRRDPFTAWTSVTVAGGGTAGAPIALLVASGGGVSYAQWAPGAAQLSTTGVCPSGSLTLTFRDGGDVVQAHTVACGSGDFQ